MQELMQLEQEYIMAAVINPSETLHNSTTSRNISRTGRVLQRMSKNTVFDVTPG